MVRVCRIQNLHISQTTAYSNSPTGEVCRIQNLHISQTWFALAIPNNMFVEFKIYISLKLKVS